MRQALLRRLRQLQGGAPPFAVAATLFARMDVQPSLTRKGHMNDLKATLIADGNWDGLDGLVIMAGHDPQANKLNWKSSSYDLTGVNNPWFEIDRGVTGGQGRLCKLTSGFIPSTAGGNFTQDSASLSLWCRTARAEDRVMAGAFGTPRSYIVPKNLTGGLVGHGMNAGTGANSFDPGDSAGFVTISRTGAAGYTVYKNGVALGTRTITSTALPSVQIELLFGNSAYTEKQAAVLAWGAGRDASHEASFYAAINTYLTALGAAGPQTTKRIMAVGDSITAGYTDNPTWALPFTWGYRGPLYDLLTAAGKRFEFVGRSLEPVTGGGFGHPDPSVWSGTDIFTLGQDNCRGYGGYALTDIEPRVAGWVAEDLPDIVLLMAGINDIAAGSSDDPVAAKTNLSDTIALIQSGAPSATIVLSKITPYVTPTPAIVLFNDYIGTLAGPGIIVVDQYSNFLDGEGDPDASLYSNANNHPNAAGYALMAQTWADAVIPLL